MLSDINVTITTVESTPSNVNNFTTFLGNLTKGWHISIPVAIFLTALIFLAISIGICVIIFYIRKRLKYYERIPKKDRYHEEASVELDIDHEKYESKYGYLELSILYDRRRKNLIIRDIRANNIVTSTSDPPDCFVKMFIKNDKKTKDIEKHTKTISDNYNPSFPESFVFPVNEINKMIVYFHLINENLNGNDILLGQGTLDMSCQPMESYTGLVHQTYVVLHAPDKVLGTGDVCIVITMRSNKQQLMILEARNLVYKYQKILMNGTIIYPPVHATITVMVDQLRRHHFETKKIRNTDCPYFRESFTLNILQEDLKKTCIKISILESETLRFSRKVGTIYLGNPKVNEKINAMGKFHWDEVCSESNSSKAMWHSLEIEKKKN